jgi:hypothetical protein
MPFDGQLLIRLLDIHLCGCLGQSQHLVVISLRHISRINM